MDYVGIIAISAVLVEAIVSAIKPIWDEEKHSISYSVVWSLAIGIIIALGAGLDVAAAVGVVITWPLVPQVISGILISRGSNYIFDLVSRVRVTSEERDNE